MPTQLRIKLAAMMFFQYAVWGAWMPILSATLNDRHIPPSSIGEIYGAFWLGCLISPFLGGQLADRKLPSQIFLALSHLLGAIAAIAVAFQKTPEGLYIGMLIWSLIYAPGMGITNSITFTHVEKYVTDEKDREREFSLLRTAGTIGWIVAAFLLLGFQLYTHLNAKNSSQPIPEMLITGMLGFVMVFVSLALPNTPPVNDKRSDPLAFRKAFRLFKTVPGFAVFMGISFFAATEFMFFYSLSAQFLESLKIPHILIPVTKSISQVAEVGALAVLLPYWLPRKGMRWCLLVGSFAWPLRYLIFAMQKPVWLVVLSLGLHGFGYAFVMVVQQLYVDRVSPKDIRASAQSLLTVVTLGLGNVIGSYLSGWVQQYYSHQAVINHTLVTVTNWPPVFVLPAVTTLLAAIAYMFTFRDKDVAMASARETEAALV